jgi:uncharacterized protein (TIGR03066 family)
MGYWNHKVLNSKIMKIIIKTTFLFFLITGLFTSCSKKKEEKPDPTTLIVGAWQAKRTENYFQPEGSTQREFVNSTASDGILELTADGKFISGGTSMGTYHVSGNILTSTSTRGGTEEYTITTLDEHNLVFEKKYENQKYNEKTGTVFQATILTK